jgi:hypothetical protein
VLLVPEVVDIGLLEEGLVTELQVEVPVGLMLEVEEIINQELQILVEVEVEEALLLHQVQVQ